MKVVDLFAGCGGMSLGFQNAGFEVVYAFDKWNAAVKCYSANFDHPISMADLSDSKSIAEKILPMNVDMIIGGPPCQDFSHAGKRTEGLRADLTDSFAEIISLVRPAFFVMENVERAMKSVAYSRAKATFIDAGYTIVEKILDASHCGVPQKRKRFFVIGMIKGNSKELSSMLEMGFEPIPMTMRDYFGESLGINVYYRHPRNYSRRGIYSIDEPAPTMRGVNRPIPSGYPGHPADAAALSPSLRPLTTLERAWVQTFPKSFIFPGSKTETEQLIGNAVPVNLAFFVGKTIKEFVESSKNTAMEGVPLEHAS